MTASWHNIRSEYDNNKLEILKDKGSQVVSSGICDYDDLNKYIHTKIGKIGNTDTMELIYYLT